MSTGTATRPPLLEWIDSQLAQLDGVGQSRRTHALVPLDATQIERDHQTVTLFSSNDYLGLAQHPEVKGAMAEAAAKWGMGNRGSALVCGFSDLHQRLETELARLKGTESALVFPTGYAANLAVLTALAGPDSAIFSDELNHASIIDGCRLARGKVHVYRHRDVDHLESLLRRSKALHSIIVTDSVFSMDGDCAPLLDLVQLKNQYGCLLVIDEAHGTLVLGQRGGGLAEHLGVADDVDLHVGTLSKAVGGVGGFVASSRRFRAWLVNRARSYIYSTALPVPVVVAAMVALRVAEDGALRHSLFQRVGQLARGLGVQLLTPIVPVILGDAPRATEVSARLLEKGLLATAMRPPSVPPGTSRLRIALSAAHSPRDLDRLLTALRAIEGWTCPGHR